jgi:hypothetical protein
VVVKPKPASTATGTKGPEVVLGSIVITPSPATTGGCPPKSMRVRNKGGHPKGLTKETQEDGRLLEQHILDFQKQHNTKKGALIYAARKVYGRVDQRKAVQRANKTLTRYRTFKKGQKPTT